MGKERFVESARQGLKSAKGFVKRKPNEVGGTVGGATFGATGLGASLNHGDALWAAINASSLAVNLMVATVGYLKSKRASSYLGENRS